MKEIRKKQKKLFAAMRVIVGITLVYIVVYIGVQPYIAELGTIKKFHYLNKPFLLKL